MTTGIITVENFERLFFSAQSETLAAMQDALEEQDYDLEWSGEALDFINFCSDRSRYT